MTLLQTFRDGYSRTPRARQELRRSVWGLLNGVLTLALMVVTAVSYHQGQYDRATFDAVLVLWCLHWRAHNGSARQS